MAIGERIRYIRKLHEITQKLFGKKLGFTDNTAETRVGQYETGVRTPKSTMIENMSKILDVSPLALNIPNIDNPVALLHTFYAIEDLYGLTINKLDDEVCLTLDKNNLNYDFMIERLQSWYKISNKYRTGLITKDEYDNWRYNYPKFDESDTKISLDN